jgi:hypothetical protein
MGTLITEKRLISIRIFHCQCLTSYARPRPVVLRGSAAILLVGQVV